MKAAIFGAGNIGRGLVGDVLSASGYELHFIDADDAIVEMLKVDRTFRVISSEGESTLAAASATHAADEEQVRAVVASADIVATAVGGAVLPIVAPAIGDGLLERTPAHVNVLACENTHPNSSALQKYVASAVGEEAIAGVGFPDVVVDRIVPGNPGARDIIVEAAAEFVVDATGWVGPMPKQGPMIFTTSLDDYKLRKLWLVNGVHALAAWLGLQAGHEYIHEAMADPAVRSLVESAGRAAAAALATETEEFTRDQLEAYLMNSLRRFANKSLPDIAVRVARNPLAKLVPNERVVGPALAAGKLGLDTEPFAEGIVAALTLDDPAVPGVAELREAMEARGWRRLVSETLGIDEATRLFEQIGERFHDRDEQRGTEVITKEIEITNPAGLHARPAAEIVERAKAREASIQIHKGEKVANAKSIMSVLALGANAGDAVKIVAEGEDAGAAVDDLLEIMLTKED